MIDTKNKMWIKKKNIFKKHWAQLPIVDVLGNNTLRIYYSNRVNNKSYPKFFDLKYDNDFAISKFDDTPILELGDLGTFDQAGVMPAEIVSYEDKKYLYYIGWSNRVDVPYFNNIGLAISEDGGDTYRKFSAGPVLGCSYKEPGYTGTISVMIENGIWRGWYLSCRKWIKINNRVEPIYDIKYAESNNGIDWDPKNITCIKLQESEGGISQASVIKIEGVYHMWFSVRGKSDYRSGGSQSYRINHAVSLDGIKWERTNEANLNPSFSGWDSEMVEYPYVVSFNANIFMFYNGNGFGKTGIGFATGDF